MTSKARDLADLLDTSGKVTADDLDVGAIGGRRNLIINGGFDVWQRGESTSNNKTSWGYPTTDRVRTSCTSSSTTYEKVVADIGGKKCNALRISFGADENQFHVEQTLENSYNIIVGNYVTFSYWIKCNNGTVTVKTGSAGAYVSNQDYDYKETVIGSEWVKVVLTSDRTSSAYDGTNEMEFRFIDNSLSKGDASLAGLSFDVAQVQLEVGTVATPFEHRSYGEELALCSRYFQYIPSMAYHIWGHGIADTSGVRMQQITFPQGIMRTTPSATYFDASSGGNSGRVRYESANKSTNETNVNISLSRSNSMFFGGFKYPYGLSNIGYDSNGGGSGLARVYRLSLDAEL